MFQQDSKTHTNKRRVQRMPDVAKYTGINQLGGFFETEQMPVFPFGGRFTLAQQRHSTGNNQVDGEK